MATAEVGVPRMPRVGRRSHHNNELEVEGSHENKDSHLDQRKTGEQRPAERAAPILKYSDEPRAPSSCHPSDIVFDSSMPPSTTLENGSSPEDLALDGLTSCAISEAETSPLQSAFYSTGDTGSKKGARRSSSSAIKTRERSGTKSSDYGCVRRLSASKIQELAASPESLPIAAIVEQPLSAGIVDAHRPLMANHLAASPQEVFDKVEDNRAQSFGGGPWNNTARSIHPGLSERTVSTPPIHRTKSAASQPPAPTSAARRNSLQPTLRPAPLSINMKQNLGPSMARNAYTEDQARINLREHREHKEPPPQSPLPPSIPLPPLSAPTLLQLELAAQRPSPLYIHQSQASDLPYESSAVKFERLKNFLFLPMSLEKTLIFGALACLDAWLWTFTILPMRFCIAFGVLFRWWAYTVGKEVRWLVAFVWEGLGRLWKRGRPGRGLSRKAIFDTPRNTDGQSRSRRSRGKESLADVTTNGTPAAHSRPNGDTPWHDASTRTTKGTNGTTRPPSRLYSRSNPAPLRHRRTKSTPSNLTSYHKADLLQGLVIICSSVALMNLDASRMYHFIRAQSAVKLYVIYNLVEVGDRLLSALGQDVFECLFSSETLSRNSSGRSKVMLPFGMFLLSLVYNCAHAITLFYQVIALNVAVNSYSNALLTLLMSNQFVEIKGSVFKRFDKENTFQLTCADVVERFQLWLVLLIIGMRNIVEVGGLSVPGAGIEIGDEGMAASRGPLHHPPILPMSFTILPSWLWSGELLSPFLIVIGSEMFVDWIKHAYINKFNNIRPNFYSRILDILCKDYYTSAFVAPSLTRRLGLPLLPLSTLFIRASFQTYHMFLATHVPAPMPQSTQTSLSVDSSTPSSPAATAALHKLDHFIRNAIGRSVYGLDDGFRANVTAHSSSAMWAWLSWSTDDAIALVTKVMVFFIAFLFLLILKLLLGILLLRYSRDRYARMKLKEHAVAAGKMEKDRYDTKGTKRFGGFGVVEVGDDRRRWIYSDDSDGLKRAKDKEKNGEQGILKEEKDLNTVIRYEMIAKRIW